MMRLERKWHLIQYDIRDPKRLRRVHRLLKSQAVAVQNSVFAWFGHTLELRDLQAKLQECIKAGEDDVRGYELHHPLMLYGSTAFVEDTYGNSLPPYQHCPIDTLHKIQSAPGSKRTPPYLKI